MDAPEHIGLDPEDNAMDTDGVTVPLTVIVTAELVAVDAVRQLALLVKIQVTASPLVKAAEVNAEEFVPAFPPFTCH